MFWLKTTLVVLSLHTFATSMFTLFVTDIRPRTAWCWIACDEENVDEKFTNHGRCWYRIVFYYGWVLVDVLLMSVGLYFILRTLRQHQRNIVSTSKRRDPIIDKANFRTTYFLITYVAQGLLQAGLRTLSTIKHDPSSEGKLGVAEHACSLIGPFWFFWAGNIKFWHYVVTPLGERLCKKRDGDEVTP